MGYVGIGRVEPKLRGFRSAAHVGFSEVLRNFHYNALYGFAKLMR